MSGRSTIRVAHSPDSDDAFMFFGLASGRVYEEGLEFVHELHDIETLNRSALDGIYEISAVSIHAYAYLQNRYALLNCGASMGEGYGPVLVGRSALPLCRLSECSIAVPGERTSAYLALRLCCPEFRHQVVPFDEIIPAILRGEADAGLVIHEGQLFYQDEGLYKLIDLGEWWQESTGLPLPLGGNVVRRDLGSAMINRLSRVMRESIAYALEHPQEALEYALQFGRGLDARRADRFVRMYVNRRTLDYGEDGRQAVRSFLQRGYQAGLIPHPVTVDFL